MTTKTIRQHQPTKEEVLAAVENRSVYTHKVDKKRTWHGLTASDVSEAIYTSHHGTPVQQMYVNRTTTLRKGVNVSAVKRCLAELAEDGRIVEVSGEHWSMAGKYGTSKVATYYLSHEAVEMAKEESRVNREAGREKAAREKAEKKVLERHRDQVEALYRQILRESPKGAQPW